MTFYSRDFYFTFEPERWRADGLYDEGVDPAHARPIGSAISNRYPGKCYRCGETVHRNRGYSWRTSSGWVTTHAGPNWSDACPTDRQAPPDARPNRYAGACAKCGARVLAGAGYLVKSDDGYGVSHLDGDAACVPGSAPLPKRSVPGGRTNRFDATCTKCRGTVPAGDGVLVRGAHGWEVSHRDDDRCDGTVQADPTDGVFPGYYAIPCVHESATGFAHTHDFVHVKAGTGRYVGRTFVSTIHGSNRTPVRDSATIKRLCERIAEDPEGAALCFSTIIGTCSQCNRQLTDDDSRRIGIGPDCRKRLDSVRAFAAATA